ncbi:MAG TPA: hypothetical protein VGN34_26850 [Ktedonobacteraceae bacterium]
MREIALVVRGQPANQRYCHLATWTGHSETVTNIRVTRFQHPLATRNKSLLRSVNEHREEIRAATTPLEG